MGSHNVTHFFLHVLKQLMKIGCIFQYSLYYMCIFIYLITNYLYLVQ